MRRWPVAAYLSSLASVAVYQALEYPIASPYFFGLLTTAYGAAADGKRWRSAALVIVGYAASAASAALSHRVELAYAVPSMAAIAFAAGQFASELRAVSKRRDEQARHDTEMRLVTEERLRIARDLHDVISHSIAMISVQAGVAAHVIDQQPEQAREALLAIRTASGDALRDLRGMLGVLRQADELEGHDPAPSLAHLPGLVERVRATGVLVALEIEGVARPLTPATELAAYRVVQEALTNVIRHAPGATVDVHLRYASEVLEVEVIDDGGSIAVAPPAPTAGSGHGLAGLRERAGTLGGTFEAGPVQGRGFRVASQLPAAATA
jgi:signal transduction histidine kinase